jgi:hypothetical protein
LGTEHENIDDNELKDMLFSLLNQIKNNQEDPVVKDLLRISESLNDSIASNMNKRGYNTPNNVEEAMGQFRHNNMEWDGELNSLVDLKSLDYMAAHRFAELEAPALVETIAESLHASVHKSDLDLEEGQSVDDILHALLLKSSVESAIFYGVIVGYLYGKEGES